MDDSGRRQRIRPEKGLRAPANCGNLVGARRRPAVPPLLPVTTVDIETLLAQEDLRALLEACEQTGSIRAPDVHEIVEAHELTGLEQEALLRELDKRGIEIVEATARSSARRCPAAPVESTTDALQLFLREAAATGC